jgi:2-dehydro-3-deoxy-D-gluconate 5-dehydrogenase
MDFKIKGRVAIVTGASRGLGKATTQALAREGVKVLAAARSIGELEELASEWRGQVVAQECDMADVGQAVRLVDRALEAFGHLDIVVNNAGIGIKGSFLEQEHIVWEQIMAINLTAPALLSRAAGRHFEKQRSGKIINIASTVSVRGKENLVAYCVSKGALLQFTRALAVEWASLGIQVNAIGPGAFATNAQRAVLESPRILEKRLGEIPSGRMGRPEEIGPLVCYLASSLSDFVTGALYLIDGGETARL